jgi:transcriptional/translational regulatory protein YebC/TACO1
MYKKLSDALKAGGVHPQEGGIRMIANQELELETNQTLQVMRTIEALEDLDDVQNVYSNLHISEEAMAALEAD